MATIVRRPALAEQAVDVLLERIASGEFALGQKLPGETTLAAQLGVGRSTVREAVRELSGKGVLESRQGSGVFVMALEPRDGWESILRRVDITKVIEARIAIESESAALAAERHTAADLLRLRAALEVRSGAEGIEGLVDADTALHRAVILAAHNDVLTELFDSLVPRVRTAMVEMLRIRRLAPSAEADQHDHRRLIDAIEVRDVQAARTLSREHLSALKASF